MKTKVIGEPELQTFTEIFLGLNRGAAWGLARLGALPYITGGIRQCASQERIDIALQVFHYVQQELLRHNLEYLMPDIVSYEHTLCKVYCALGKAPHSYSLYQRYLEFARVSGGDDDDD